MKYVKYMAALCLAGALSVFAEDATFTVIDGTEDWREATNYVGQVVPGAGAIVHIPANATVYIKSKEQADFVSNFLRIYPDAKTSHLVIDVPEEGDWAISCGITAANAAALGNKDFEKGMVIKRGAGSVTVGGGKKVPLSNSAISFVDVWTCFTIEEGALKLPQDLDVAGNFYLGYVTISNGAAFHPTTRTAEAKKNDISAATYLRGLFGEGQVVRNGSTIFMIMNEPKQPVSEFYGTLVGYAGLKGYNGGTVNLWSPTSLATSGAFSSTGGTLGIFKFNGETDTDSTLGASAVYVSIELSKDYPSCIRYLGTTGETVSRKFVIHKNTYSNPAIIDAGEMGGLILGADSQLVVLDNKNDPTTGKSVSRHLIFTGNHVNECVMGADLLADQYLGTSNGSIYIVKEGTGTWRFADGSNWRYMANGYAIREGVFAFDSLQEKGSVCALGLATNLTDGTLLTYEPQVSYAFKLGSTNAAATTSAVMAFTGTNGFLCGTRPIALIGDGTLRNSTAHAIRFAGVSGLSEGKALKTFTLDGTCTASNEVADITDGAGKVGVTKKGTGLWVLSGNQTFSGPLNVEEGTLVARPTLPGNFTWFRWIIRQVRANTSSDFSVNEFDIFDADGKPLMPATTEYNHCVAELAPGQVSLQTECAFEPIAINNNSDKSGELKHLFSHGTDYGFQGHMCKYGLTTKYVTITNTNPASWNSVVFRVPNGSKAASSHDIMNTWNKGSGSYRDVTAYTIEGSVDGLHWTKMADVDDIEPSSASWTWAFSKKTNGFSPHTGGMAFAEDVKATTQTYSMLENTVVSVAPGATFKAEGAVTLSGLRVTATGGGTLDGFSFAATGSLDVTGLAANAEEVVIPITFQNATGLTNITAANWPLKCDGVMDHGHWYKVTSSGVTVRVKGLVILVK